MQGFYLQLKVFENKMKQKQQQQQTQKIPRCFDVFSGSTYFWKEACGIKLIIT